MILRGGGGKIAGVDIAYTESPKTDQDDRNRKK